MNAVELHPRTKSFIEQTVLPAYINGEFKVFNSTPVSVTNPANASELANVTACSESDVNEAVESANKAFPKWASLTPNERAGWLHRLADVMEENGEVLAQLECLDVGKPIENARGFDVPFGVECFRYFADMCVQAQYDQPLAIKNMEARIHQAPYGVCGFIFPWNFPYTLFCWGVAPALAAGNPVVVKAAAETPLSTLYVGQLAKEIGFPEGVINIYTGSGRECGQPLAEHPLVKRMSFTGSTEVGRIIGRICGERIIPSKLELGGKGAAMVFDDANIQAVAEGLAGAITLNTGQVCCTATRWFIHEKVYDSFVDSVSKVIASTRINNGMIEGTQMGPLVSQKQFDRVAHYYEQGIAQGACPVVKLETPTIENAANGFFMTPHLLSGNDENICFKEEVFGPTAYLVKFKDQEDGIQRVNKLAYGLANSVWSQDLARANQVAEQIISGNSWINAHNVFAYGLPYGGVNESGFGGGVNSPETFKDYLRPQTIARPLQ